MKPRNRSGTTLALCAALLLTGACAQDRPGGGEAGGSPAPTRTPSATKPFPLKPTGGWLAYSTFIDGRDRIHLVRPDGSQDHQAFTELDGEAIRADFAPDGRIAFEHRPPDGVTNVYVAGPDGENARIVAACTWDKCQRESPTWSPDGKRLATFVTLGRPEGDGPPPEFGLAVIDVATEAVRIVLRHPSHLFQDGIPRWSPDGRRLVFYRWRSDTGEEGPDAQAAVFVVNVDGSGLKQLTPWELRCGDPDWSPDGSTIVCGTHPPYDFDTGRGEIYAMKPDGTGLRALTSNGPTGPRAAHPRFTPDGRTLLFIRSATQDWMAPPRHIYALDPASGRQGPVLTERDIYTRPVLQPSP